MRRTICLFVLMTALVCSCGCAGTAGDEEWVRQFQSELSQQGRLETEALVCAEGREYTLSCQCGEEEYRLHVLAPEEISGVECVITGDELQLAYSGVLLDAGSLNSEGLNPISAIPCMIAALKTGWCTQTWREEQRGVECIAAQFRVSEESLLTVWLEPELRAPVCAELDNGGKVILSMTITSWIEG